jgi:hypothetical protein
MFKAARPCLFLWAVLGVGLTMRYLQLHPWLEFINVGLAAVCGMLTGVGFVGTAWLSYHRRQRDCLAKISLKCRLELEARGFFDVHSPFAGDDARAGEANADEGDAAQL